TRFSRDWSSDVCSSDLAGSPKQIGFHGRENRQHRTEGRQLRSGCPHQQQRFSLSLSQRAHPGEVLGEIPPLLPNVEAGQAHIGGSPLDLCASSAPIFFFNILWRFFFGG